MSGCTALHEAAVHGFADVVSLLLQYGARTDVVSNGKWTPLHFSSRNGHKEVTNILLQGGATPNIIDKKGWTPLHEGLILIILYKFFLTSD